jgi:TatD DNase family protein
LPSDYEPLASRLDDRRDVRVAIGFHPLASPSNETAALATFSNKLGETDYVGEVGLDFSGQSARSRGEQLEIFEVILSDPHIRGKILTVHSRGAESETIRLLAASRAKAIMHWYMGPLDPVDDALAAGLFFSINPAMLAGEDGRRLLSMLPRERVLTETDGPWTRVSGHPAEPADIPAIVREVAYAWNVDSGDARDLIFENACALHDAANLHARLLESRREG